MVVSSVTPLICRQARRVPLRILLELGLDAWRTAPWLPRCRACRAPRCPSRPCAEVQQQRGVAAVVEDHVGVAAVRPFEDAVGVVPVVRQRFALDGEHRRATRGDGGSSVVLGGEDVARGPAYLRTERLQRLDQHGGLDGHVQRTGDARAFERLASWRTLRGWPSGRAFRFRRWRFLCGPTRPG